MIGRGSSKIALIKTIPIIKLEKNCGCLLMKKQENLLPKKKPMASPIK